MQRKIFLLTFVFSTLTFWNGYSAESGGMPQLNPEFWISQIFWLIISFGVLFVILSKFILPKIRNNIELRKSQILDNIETAEKQKVESENKLKDYENLIVTRTFSKAYGLAGLRIGYSVSNPEIADLMNRLRQPFNVNSLSLVAAGLALDEKDFLDESISINTNGMKFLEKTFARLDLEYIRSAGNFLTVDLGQNALPIYELLLQKGIIVRPIGVYGLPNHLRVSIGLPHENERFSAALAEVLSNLQS